MTKIKIKNIAVSLSQVLSSNVDLRLLLCTEIFIHDIAYVLCKKKDESHQEYQALIKNKSSCHKEKKETKLECIYI